MKRAWVTGGAGFIGSHLCEALLAKGVEVHCFDNLSSGRLENMVRAECEQGFRLLRWDVDATPLSDYRGERPDIIYHLAGHASPEDYTSRPLETLLSSSDGLKGALQAALVHKCPIVFTSTSEIYGTAPVVPTPEDAIGAVNTLGPRACYDEGKRFGEALCYVFRKTAGCDVRIARIFNTYGPRLMPGDGRVVSSFLSAALEKRPIQIHGDGSHTRSFCYVSDTVEGLMAVGEKGAAGGVWNIGNPRETSINELAEMVSKLTGQPLVIQHTPSDADDPPRRSPNIQKAFQDLQWSPRVSLEDGLKWTLEWLKEHWQGRRV